MGPKKSFRVLLCLAALPPLSAGLLVGGGRPAAAMAPPQPASCGFTFGRVTPGFAAGTEIFDVALNPATPYQRCSTSVTVTGAVITASGAAPAGVHDNSATETTTASFVPSQLDPVVRFSWGGYCTTTAEPVYLALHAAGQSAIDPLGTSASCESKQLPGSGLLAGPSGPSISFVALASTIGGSGYRVVNQQGFVVDKGSASFLVSEPDTTSPVVGIAAAAKGNGDWLVTANGGVFSYGSAAFHGSATNLHLNAPIVGMAADPATGGYWLVGADGGVFSYGDAFHGSAASIKLNAPVAGITATPHGGGYWLVGADGGVFAYGDARFAGSAVGFF